MPSLQVRDLPDHIYHQLLTAAKKQHRSLAQQAVVALSKGLGKHSDPKSRRKKLMRHIRTGQALIHSDRLKSPADLIREDRDRP